MVLIRYVGWRETGCGLRICLTQANLPVKAGYALLNLSGVAIVRRHLHIPIETPYRSPLY